MFVFITMLAVGLDYDIFMVSRVREDVLKGVSDQEAIKTSIIENGGVIITLSTKTKEAYNASKDFIQGAKKGSDRKNKKHNQ